MVTATATLETVQARHASNVEDVAPQDDGYTPVHGYIDGAAMVELDSLRKIILAFKPWIGRKSVGPLGSMLVSCDAGRLSFTTATRGARLTASVVSDAKPFTALVDVAALQKIIGKRKGVAEFLSNDDGGVWLSVGSREANMKSKWSPDDFASDGDGKTARVLDVQSWDAVADVVGAASNDDSRPILCGVLFDQAGEVVATDSFRLYRTVGAVAPFKAPKGVDSVIVDADRLGRFLKLADADSKACVVSSGGTQSFVASGVHSKDSSIELECSIRLTEGAFPNYRGLLVDTANAPQQIEVTPDFVRSVDEAHGILKGSAVPFRISALDSGNVEIVSMLETLSTTDKVAAPNKLDAKAGGLVVAFNPEYAKAAFVEGGTLYGNDGMKPWVQVDMFDGLRRERLLMPVRVS